MVEGNRLFSLTVSPAFLMQGKVRLPASLCFVFAAHTFEAASGCTWQDFDGQLGEQDGSIFSLFRYQGELQLILDHIHVRINGDPTTSMETTEQERCFRVFQGSELLYEKRYTRKPESAGNPFWPSEAEDEDILLWIHSIVSSKLRQSIMLQK